MPYLTPGTLPEESVCRSLQVPDTDVWLSIVSGAILELTKEYNWEQAGAVTPEQAAQRMLSMWLAFSGSDCVGVCPRIRRMGEGGVIEVSDDGGETFTPDTETIPPTPARPHENDPVLQRCLASANAANVLQLTYEQSIDEWNINGTVEYGKIAFAGILGALISTLFGAPAIVVAIAGEIFTQAWGALGVLLADYWNTEITTRLRCILFRNSSIDGDVVHFNYDGVYAELNASFFSGIFQLPQTLVWQQIIRMLSILGAGALEHAGATTAITSASCADCGENTWSATFMFNGIFEDGQRRGSVGQSQGWRLYPGSMVSDGWRPVEGCIGQFDFGERGIVFPPGTNCTDIRFRVQSYGSGNAHYELRWNGARIADMGVNSQGITLYDQPVLVPVNGTGVMTVRSYDAAGCTQAIYHLQLRGTGLNPFSSQANSVHED
jgi:hypothetical protein